MRLLVGACLLLASIALVLGEPTGVARAAAAPVPTPPDLPAAIEPLAGYQGAQVCDPVARKGPKKLSKLLRATYGSTAFGITRACSGGSATSEHMEGRALDWMISGKAQKKNANAFLDWLLAADSDGNKQAMARRMGIMYIVWDNRMFRMYETSRGWEEYSGCLSTPSASYDTTCHRNHVHFSFSWDGAAAKTSYWSGRAVTAPNCPSPGSVAAAPPVPTTGLELVPLPPARILDTSSAVGVSTRCRLSQEAWSGDIRRIDLQVAGRGGVPETGASAVMLSLQLRSPNAPTKLFVRPTGASTKRVRVSTTAQSVHGLGAVTVPLGSGGRVSLTLSTGASDVTVDVLGYYRSPDGATSLFHPADPKRVFGATKAAASLEPGESRVLTVAGLGDVPDSGATAVSLAATVSKGSKSGGATVFGGGDSEPAADLLSVSAPAGEQRTNLVLARVGSDGTVIVRNDDAGSRRVRLDLLGWWAPETVPGGSRYVLLPPKEIIDTTQGKALGGALVPGVTATPRLMGKRGLPTSGVTAVALQATALEPSADASLVAWPAGDLKPKTRAASVQGSSDHTAFIVAPLTDGSVALRSGKSAFDLRAFVVGYWFQP